MPTAARANGGRRVTGKSAKPRRAKNAAKKVIDKASKPVQVLTPEQREKEQRKKKKKKNKNKRPGRGKTSFHIYLKTLINSPAVLGTTASDEHQLQSNDTTSLMLDMMLHDILDRVATAAARMAATNRRGTMTVHDVEKAAALVFGPKEYRKDPVNAGHKAVAKYNEPRKE